VEFRGPFLLVGTPLVLFRLLAKIIITRPDISDAELDHIRERVAGEEFP